MGTVPDGSTDTRFIGKEHGRGAARLLRFVQPFSGRVNFFFPERLAQKRAFGDYYGVAIRELTHEIATFPRGAGFDTTKIGGVAGLDVESVAVLVIEGAIELPGMLQNQIRAFVEIIKVVLSIIPFGKSERH